MHTDVRACVRVSMSLQHCTTLARTTPIIGFIHFKWESWLWLYQIILSLMPGKAPWLLYDWRGSGNIPMVSLRIQFIDTFDLYCIWFAFICRHKCVCFSIFQVVWLCFVRVFGVVCACACHAHVQFSILAYIRTFFQSFFMRRYQLLR